MDQHDACSKCLIIVYSVLMSVCFPSFRVIVSLYTTCYDCHIRYGYFYITVEITCNIIKGHSKGLHTLFLKKKSHIRHVKCDVTVEFISQNALGMSQVIEKLRCDCQK